MVGEFKLWSILEVLGNWGRSCPFDVIFRANGSVFRAGHDPLLRTAYFLSKTRVLRVRKERSTLKIVLRFLARDRISKVDPQYPVLAVIDCS